MKQRIVKENFQLLFYWSNDFSCISQGPEACIVPIALKPLSTNTPKWCQTSMDSLELAFIPSLLHMVDLSAMIVHSFKVSFRL